MQKILIRLGVAGAVRSFFDYRAIGIGGVFGIGLIFGKLHQLVVNKLCSFVFGGLGGNIERSHQLVGSKVKIGFFRVQVSVEM